MSTDERYEGWANRETWAVALHINNDQGWQESVHEAIRGLDLSRPGGPTHPLAIEREYAHHAGEIIRENVEDALTLPDAGVLIRYGSDGNRGSGSVTDYVERVLPILTDIGSLWRVDWTELGAAFLEDIAEGDA